MVGKGEHESYDHEVHLPSSCFCSGTEALLNTEASSFAAQNLVVYPSEEEKRRRGNEYRCIFLELGVSGSFHKMRQSLARLSVYKCLVEIRYSTLTKTLQTCSYNDGGGTGGGNQPKLRYSASYSLYLVHEAGYSSHT